MECDRTLESVARAYLCSVLGVSRQKQDLTLPSLIGAAESSAVRQTSPVIHEDKRFVGSSGRDSEEAIGRPGMGLTIRGWSSSSEEPNGEPGTARSSVSGAVGTPGTPLVHRRSIFNAMKTAKIRPVSFYGLVALIFFSVSGGPFGSEASVSAAGGPFWAIVCFLVFPPLWCLPEALLTAELSSVFPGNTGYVSWVTAAFGPYWGFIEGSLSWVSTVTNNGLYPHLFLEYLKLNVSEEVASFISAHSQGIVFTFSVGMAYVNYRGLEAVSALGLFLLVFIMVPFCTLIVFGLPYVSPSNWLVGAGSVPSQASLLHLANIVFWNLSNWDTVSTLSGEVSNARKTIPRAMLFALALTTMSYLLPLLVGTGAEPAGSDFSNWEAGHYTVVAREVAGPWLSYWVLLAATVACVGQFQALVSSGAYQLSGMSELGWLPKFINRKSKYDTPTLAIVLGTAVILGQSMLNFLDILQYQNIVYAMAQVLEFTSFLKLRWQFDGVTMRRPFEIPLGFSGCAAMLVVPYLVLAFIFALPFITGSHDIAIFGGCVIVGANLLYFIIERCRSTRALEFARDPPSGVHELVACHATPLLFPVPSSVRSSVAGGSRSMMRGSSDLLSPNRSSLRGLMTPLILENR